MTKPLTKTVCQLDKNGYYSGEAVAYLDVNVPNGEYLLPGGCVDSAAPETKANHVAKWDFDTASWQYLADYRGQTVYSTADGSAVVIDTVGELPADVTTEPRPSAAYEWNGKAWIENAAKATELAAAELAAAKTAKLTEINTAAAQFVAKLAETDKVPDFEVQTWTIQADEAAAWEQDSSADTPVLAKIAAARGIPLDTLRAAALRKAKAYSALSAAVAGQRQAYVDQLNAAADVAAVEAINPQYKAV